MTDRTVAQLETRLNDLECQLAFQEQTIEELNDALAQQQLLLTKMQHQMKYMVGKMKNMETSNMAEPAKEPPPPHY
ncbi:SlyX family protein [Vibrio navarrensis]|uniref:Protein SlyX homolog n=1 Tax=Vibrio navarrensis TaxID=29495 RepID=A0A099LQ84_9VIBR|nr:SlyX family protein [Vibrio navarrensis]KGK09442.1 protein SlyX-like protein [Vibrio navarrensis]MBE4616438.1 SlyX protein [Vibrio navarrensis]QOD70332.1 SlyX family protein [Vibrio navarrensis]